MKITQVNKDKYQINLSEKEMRALNLIAMNIGGISWVRDIVSNGEDSFLRQSWQYIDPIYPKDLNVNVSFADYSGMYIYDLKPKRDSRGRFCKKG